MLRKKTLLGTTKKDESEEDAMLRATKETAKFNLKLERFYYYFGSYVLEVLEEIPYDKWPQFAKNIFEVQLKGPHPEVKELIEYFISNLPK